MTPNIKARESNLVIMYKIEPGDGTRYTVAVCLISVEQGRDIIRGASEDYVLVVPFTPIGYTYPFLRGMLQPWSYVADKMNLIPHTAKLYAAIMPALTSMAPPDDILAAAVAHLEREETRP